MSTSKFCVNVFSSQQGHILLDSPLYSGLRVDGTIPKLGGLYGSPSKRHLGGCAIYSETIVKTYSPTLTCYVICVSHPSTVSGILAVLDLESQGLRVEGKRCSVGIPHLAGGCSCGIPKTKSLPCCPSPAVLFQVPKRLRGVKKT